LRFITEYAAFWFEQRKLREQSIRWKAFWVEAASSLYGGGVRAALVMQVVSESGAATRRSRSRGQRCPRVVPRGAQAPKRRSAGESPRALARKLEGFTLGRVVRRESCGAISSHRMVPVGGACRRRGNVRGRRTESVKAPPGVISRGGSACKVASNRRKAGLLRELGLERARVRSMESVERPSTERQGMHRSASYRSWWAVIPPPILPGSGGANHTGLVGKGIDSNR